MKALVLGCGSIGRRHAANLSSLGVEVIVTDLDANQAEAVASLTNSEAVDRDAVPYLDLVIIATPTASHVADLEWGLSRDAHVFVEKPLASTTNELERAAFAAASAPDQHVMVGCNLRFTSGFQLLRHELRSAGPLAALLVDFGWWLPAWRPGADYRDQYSARRELGGGIILDAIHEIDYVMALGGPVDAISCHWSRTGILAGDVEDLADIVLRHRSGVQSHVHVDYLRRAYTRSCTAIAADAEVRWNFALGRVDRVVSPGDHPEVIAEHLDVDPNVAYVDEMRHFVECVDRNVSPLNGITEAVEVTSVALRALAEGAS